MPGISYDAVATFLVFLIGVPALVIQSMPTEVRRAVMKQPLELFFVSGAPALFGLVAAGIGVVLVATHALPQVPDEIIGTLVVGLLFLISAFAAGFIPYRYGQRDIVIRHLRQAAARPLNKDPQLDQRALVTLLELGEQSEPGEDKQLVLEALYEVADAVCRHNRYRGDSLEVLITQLVNLLASDSQPGNARNFYTAAQVLQSIVMTPECPEGQPSVDLVHTVHALEHLSRVALTRVGEISEVESTLRNCIESLELASTRERSITTDASEALFKIGVAALEKNQMLIAVNALDKLYTMVEANQPAKGELVVDTLALSAHFWGNDGTARTLVRDKLAQAQGLFAQDLSGALEFAKDHCRRTTLFQTADYIQKMMTNLEPL